MKALGTPLPLLSTVSLIIGTHHTLQVSLGGADFGHVLACTEPYIRDKLITRGFVDPATQGTLIST